MSFFNPFAELFETEHYMHARTLRTTFTQKMRDTFFSFFGSFNILERDDKNKAGKYHIGILDVFTLGISYLITLVPTALVSEVKSTPLQVIFGLIAGALMLSRAIIAGILTLISSPFIGIAQAISSSKASDLKNKINTYTVSEQDKDGNEIKTSLSALLKNRGLSIETVEQMEKVKLPLDQYQPLGKLKLKFFGSEPQNPATLTMNIDKKGNLTNKKDKELFEDLAKLNVGNFQRDNERDEIEAAAKIAPKN
ncbi:MAG: hypothetical protein Q8M40_13635 [Legionella sp.]|nr:hypothetical protein [Legionella sp.]